VRCESRELLEQCKFLVAEGATRRNQRDARYETFIRCSLRVTRLTRASSRRALAACSPPPSSRLHSEARCRRAARCGTPASRRAPCARPTIRTSTGYATRSRSHIAAATSRAGRRTRSQPRTTDSFSNYEFDHLIPLGIGRSDDESNIWPEPIDQASVKDKLEDELYRELAAGTITQADAVAQMLAWRPACAQ
jgi:hypothetical protein